MKFTVNAHKNYNILLISESYFFSINFFRSDLVFNFEIHFNIQNTIKS